VAGAVGSGSLKKLQASAGVHVGLGVEPPGYRVHGAHGPLDSARSVSAPDCSLTVSPAAQRTAGNPIGNCPRADSNNSSTTGRFRRGQRPGGPAPWSRPGGAAATGHSNDALLRWHQRPVSTSAVHSRFVGRRCEVSGGLRNGVRHTGPAIGRAGTGRSDRDGQRLLWNASTIELGMRPRSDTW
jgi:hypothetical protein